MAIGPSYKVARRRRREGKTNYHKRYKMIRSKGIRAVVRKTNRYIIIQFIYPTPIGDYTLTSAHSIELVKLFGWKGGTKNTPAAYLTGLLAGLRAKKLGILRAIPDIGLHRPVKGSKVFAALKGIIDAGIELPCSQDMFPSEERIKGMTIAKYAEQLANTNPEVFSRQFSAILQRGFDPRNMERHFDEVKSKIIEIYSKIPESNEAIAIIKELIGG